MIEAPMPAGELGASSRAGDVRVVRRRRRRARTLNPTPTSAKIAVLSSGGFPTVYFQAQFE